MKEVTAITVSTIWLCIAFAFSCVLLNSCTNPTDVSAGYENARRAAIDAWEEVIGPVSDKCYNRTKNAIVVESKYFPESCIPGGKYIGCTFPIKDVALGDDMIFLLETRTELQKLDTAVHEFIHLLDVCMNGGLVIDLKLATECVNNLSVDIDLKTLCADVSGDPFHLDERLWGRHGTSTVEAVGCANL